MTHEEIKTKKAAEIAIVDKLSELLIKRKMENRKEKYLVHWKYRKNKWDVCAMTATYDGAIRLINDFKCHDKNNGQEYKYRIVKQTIQEEVVYDELKLRKEN